MTPGPAEPPPVDQRALQKGFVPPARSPAVRLVVGTVAPPASLSRLVNTSVVPDSSFRRNACCRPAAIAVVWAAVRSVGGFVEATVMPGWQTEPAVTLVPQEPLAQ